MSSTLQKPQSLSEWEVKWIRELALSNFFFFASFILDFIYEDTYLTADIHKPIADILQDYETTTRASITLPRSWLKSTLCTIAYPIWRAIKNPNIRILIVQNTAPNAEKKLAAIRGQFESNPLLRTLFPEVLPGRDNTWTTQALQLTRTAAHPEATIETAGTRTKVVSRHYDLIVEDDTVAPDLDELGEENIAPTKEDIEQAIGFHKLCIPLLIDPLHSQIVVVGTRWFERDLLSWIRDNEPAYVKVQRACRETDGRPDPMGVITWPARFGEEVLKIIRDGMGAYMFSCLYLNMPLRSEDMPFRESMFQYYGVLPTGLICVTTVDPAGGKMPGSKNKRASDWNVVCTCGKDYRTGDIYVLEVTRFRGNPGHLINEIFRHQKQWGSINVGIEGVQYQKSLEYWVKEFQKKTGQLFGVTILKSIQSKEFRVRGLCPVMMAGKLWFHPTLMRFLVSELLFFPYGQFDDSADALSMILQLFKLTRMPEITEDGPPDPWDIEGALEELRSSRVTPGDIVSEMFSPKDDETEGPRGVFELRHLTMN